MRSNTLIIVIITLAITLSIGSALQQWQNHEEAKVAMANGLQQCLENYRVLWKKECK